MAVITVQCGNYANYVGTHFWNIQESEFVYGGDPSTNSSEMKYNTTDHDVLYREGINLSRQTTYTPRLVTVDLKGSLGTLPELGELYGGPGQPKSSATNWSGGLDIVKSEPVRKNRFLQQLEDEAGDMGEEGGEKDRDTVEGKVSQGVTGDGEEGYDLDGEVGYWSDYLYSRFHPKSVLVVESYQHNNSMHPFDLFGLGTSLWNDTHQDVGDEMEDRIRFFAEECDKLQGFHVITDFSTAFGGFSTKLNTMLQDDYSGKCVVNFPVSPPAPQDFSFHKCAAVLANSALTISSIMEEGFVTPLSLGQDWFPLQNRTIDLPHIQYKPELYYHTSCLLGSALENATLVYRQKTGATQMCDVVQGLSAGHRNMASLSISMPLDLSGNKNFETDAFTKLTPLLPSAAAVTAGGSIPARRPDLLTLRGVLGSAVFKHRSSEYACLSSPEEYLEHCAASQLVHSMPRLYCHTKPLKTGKPFPKIFSPDVSSDGQIHAKIRPGQDPVKFVPVLSSWSCGQAAASALSLLASRSKKLNVSKLPRLFDSGVEEGDWTECVETILSATENYQISS